MEDVITNSINYIQKNFPEVSIKEKKELVVFEGRFLIDAKKDSFEIHEAPLLKIEMTDKYPSVHPVCYDIENSITYDHVNINKDLCLSTEIDVEIKIQNSTCISDYIEELVIPYFLSYFYWLKYGRDLFGDYSHGGKGIYESVKNFLREPNLSEREFYYLLYWAAKKKKFKRLIPKEMQKSFLRKHSKNVKKLRTLGIPLLRRQIKML